MRGTFLNRLQKGGFKNYVLPKSLLKSAINLYELWNPRKIRTFPYNPEKHSYTDSVYELVFPSLRNWSIIQSGVQSNLTTVIFGDDIELLSSVSPEITQTGNQLRSYFEINKKFTFDHESLIYLDR